MKWISVKDRLPNDKDRSLYSVFVMNANYNYQIYKATYYVSSNTWKLDSSCGGRCDQIPIIVTHWCEIEYPGKEKNV